MYKSNNFTLPELVVVILVITFSVVLLPGIIANVLTLNNSQLCKANLKKCYDATISYMNDHNGIRVNDAKNGRLGEWGRVLFDGSYLKNRKAMSCPNDPSPIGWHNTYGSWISNTREINMRSAAYAKVPPSKLLIYADCFRSDDKHTPKRSINKLNGCPSGPYHGIVTFMHVGDKAGVITYDGSVKLVSDSSFKGAPPAFKNADIVLERYKNGRFNPVRKVQKFKGNSYLIPYQAEKTDMAKRHPIPVNSAVSSGKLVYKGENHNGYKVLDMWQSPMPDPKKPNHGYDMVKNIKHSIIYKGNRKNGGYNHHANLTRYNGLFYVTWSNQPYGEDCPGQRVLYATSKDGLHWSHAKELFPPPVKVGNRKSRGSYLAASGFFVWNERLFGRASGHQILYWTNKAGTSRNPFYDETHIYPHVVHYSYICREVKPDGTLGKIFVMGNNPPKADYEILKQSQVEPDLKMPSSGLKNLMVQGPDTKRLCEPTPYRTKDGKYGLLLRDDNFSHRKYATFSDDGVNWPVAEPTNIPDSPSYTVALSGSDGSVLFIGNHMAPRFDIPTPRHYGRDPLMVSWSPDGYKLMKTYAVRSGPHNYTIPREEVFGRGGGAQYPMAIVINGKVYLMYSSGKEDIMMSVFPLSAIGVNENIKFSVLR